MEIPTNYTFVGPKHKIIVAVSTVADGTMHDRTQFHNPHIISNRKAWLKALGTSIEDTTLVCISYADGENYCRYGVASLDSKGAGMTSDNTFISDALVTTSPGHALFLPVADCVATTLYDPVRDVLMLSHLGRHSLEQNGAVKSIEYLTENYGSNPKDIQVWLSPAVGKDNYKIFALNNMGMKEALCAQLAEAGVDATHITDIAHDTATHEAYYSHSAYLQGDEAKNGRFAMVAMMLPN